MDQVTGEKGKVGFVGLGIMGKNMARHLMDGGFQLVVTDLRPEAAAPFLERGAEWADDVAGVARASDVVLTALPGPADVEAVVLGPAGILENLSPGDTYIDLSTNSPSTVRGIFARGKELGVDVLDATMSGGMHGAETRQLSLIVGGEHSVYERRLPLLEAMSVRVLYAGASGAGAVTKIVNNMISLCNSILIGDALILGVKSGVDLAVMADIIGKSTGATWRMNESFPRYIFQGDFEPGFAVDLAVKDLGLAKGLADEEGFTSECLDLFYDTYIEAQKRGWGREHSEAVVKLAEEASGVELRIEQ